MEKVKIIPTPLSGVVKVPPSKSFAHRAVIAAFLSGDECKINNIRLSDDVSATVDCIRALGGVAVYDEDLECLTISKNDKELNEKICLDCSESGSTLRFLIPIAICLGKTIEFSGRGRLMERPLSPYFEIFDQKGISYELKNGKLIIDGKLNGGEFKIDGGVSSQFVTGLLFALPMLDDDSTIVINGNLSSKAYVDITLQVLKDFGIIIKNDNYKTFFIEGRQKYKAREYTVEGDFSQAAFFFVAGALGCDIVCAGLNPDSLQGDKKILEILKSVGAQADQVGDDAYKVTAGTTLNQTVIDVDEIPDLVPICAVLFAFCKGESRITNAARLRLKESDRLAAISAELKNLGADIYEGTDSLVICGRQMLCGSEVSSHNDHRIAMALAIAACRCEGEVIIDGAIKAVNKSYPDFFEDYKSLGAEMEID